MLFRLTFILCCVFTVVTVDAAEQPERGAEDPAVVGRSFEWDVAFPERAWEFIVIHHSATTRGSVESIHREHRSRRDRNGQPWLGIGYHFVIGNGDGMADGEISASFRWKEQLHGAHSGSLRHNGRGIGICLIGNFEESDPTEAQLAAVTRLIGALAVRYDIPRSRVIGHHQVRETACPGRRFPLREVVEDSIPERSNQAYRFRSYYFFQQY